MGLYRAAGRSRAGSWGTKWRITLAEDLFFRILSSGGPLLSRYLSRENEGITA
jgi:hypothetical protein